MLLVLFDTQIYNIFVNIANLLPLYCQITIIITNFGIIFAFMS